MVLARIRAFGPGRKVLGQVSILLVARGYAVEAARALIGWARDALHIRHFIAHCDADNLASQAVMRKLGMTLTDTSGTRKNRGSDELRREYLYELTI